MKGNACQILSQYGVAAVVYRNTGVPAGFAVFSSDVLARNRTFLPKVYLSELFSGKIMQS